MKIKSRFFQFLAGISFLLLSQTTWSWFGDNHNLWSAMRHHFVLPSNTHNPAVKQQIRWFETHPQYLEKVITQASPYLYYIYNQVEESDLPAEIALLPMIESAYDPFAYSPAGAAGLWQLMPGTASGLGLKQNWWYDGRRDIYASTQAALNYVTYLRNFFDGKWLLAIAAYDSGAGTVQNAVNRNAKAHRRTDFWRLALPHETKSYIPRLLALAEVIKHPGRHGIKLPKVTNEPYFQQIDIGHQVDLANVAKIAKISEKELYLLNPGYNRWTMDPKGPYTIVLPRDRIKIVRANIDKLPTQDHVTWRHHIVKNGENLGRIAEKYKTSVALLKAVNKLSTDVIHIKQLLLIPTATHDFRHFGNIKRRKVITARLKRLGPKQYRHQVKPFQNMHQIAHIYNVKPAAIRFWNQLRTNKLHDSQTLVIWSKLSANQVAMRQGIHYKIKPGDTLSAISHRYHISVKKLKQDNRNARKKFLKVGDELVILT